MKLKTIMAAALVFGLIQNPTKAGFLSQGSLEKPVEIDKKEKQKVKVTATPIAVDSDGNCKLDLEIHNDSNWNISEIKINVVVGENNRSFSVDDYFLENQKVENGIIAGGTPKRSSIPKNKTRQWSVFVGKFLKTGWTFSVESIKGFED